MQNFPHLVCKTFCIKWFANPKFTNFANQFCFTNLNPDRNVDLKKQKLQRTINKGGIVLGQLEDNLIKIKHNKDMTAGDMKNSYAINSKVHRMVYLFSTCN